MGRKETQKDNQPPSVTDRVAGWATCPLEHEEITHAGQGLGRIFFFRMRHVHPLFDIPLTVLMRQDGHFQPHVRLALAGRGEGRWLRSKGAWWLRSMGTRRIGRDPLARAPSFGWFERSLHRVPRGVGWAEAATQATVGRLVATCRHLDFSPVKLVGPHHTPYAARQSAMAALRMHSYSEENVRRTASGSW